MTPKDISVFLYLLFACILSLVWAQNRRYQNPWINVVRRHACSIVDCSIGQVCDLSYQNCRPSGPCFLKQPTCVRAVRRQRPGNCPSPQRNPISRFTVDCFDDSGCGRSQLCCHSYYSSYCWLPGSRRTARSMIPRVTERRGTANTNSVNRLRLSLG